MNLNELISILENYINGKINIRALEDWYVPRFEQLIKDSITSDIISALELGLAELSAGFRTEDELRRLLLESMVKVNTVILFEKHETLSTSSTGTASNYSLDWTDPDHVKTSITWDLAYQRQ